MEKISGIVCILAIILMIATPISIYFSIKMPADIQYKNDIGDYIVMAYDQSDFTKMLQYVEIIDNKAHVIFAGRDWSRTYNTWWPADQTFSNSLQASDDYFEGLKQTLRLTIAEEAKYSDPNYNPLVPFSQFRLQALNNCRNEMRYGGGIGWAIEGCWYLTFAPAAYWSMWWMIGAFVIFVVIALISGLISCATSY